MSRSELRIPKSWTSNCNWRDMAFSDKPWKRKLVIDGWRERWTAQLYTTFMIRAAWRTNTTAIECISNVFMALQETMLKQVTGSLVIKLWNSIILVRRTVNYRVDILKFFFNRQCRSWCCKAWMSRWLFGALLGYSVPNWHWQSQVKIRTSIHLLY